MREEGKESGGLLSQFNRRPCPAITTSLTTTSDSAHDTSSGTVYDVVRGRNLLQSNGGRRRHLLPFAAIFSLGFHLTL